MQELATKPISTQLGRGVVRQTWGKKGKKQERKPREERKDALCWTQDPPKPPYAISLFSPLSKFTILNIISTEYNKP
jgi:hypothetical protein